MNEKDDSSSSPWGPCKEEICQVKKKNCDWTKGEKSVTCSEGLQNNKKNIFYKVCFSTSYCIWINQSGDVWIDAAHKTQM